NYAEVLKELEDLVTRTYGLWDHNRVGFQWRHYTWNHTMRVRAMSMELGKREGGDVTKLEVAGTLHDITKRYDGEILTDDNRKRVVDKNGFWLNETLMPSRENIVTQIYHENDLYGQVHHESGALITEKILSKYDFEPDFVDAVTSIVLAHLKPMNLTEEQFKLLYRNIENQILYDADTMDANVGYTAFFRNVHIHAYFAIQRNGKFELETYVQSLPRWIDSKQTFAEQLLTESAREVAHERQDRKRLLAAQLASDLSDIPTNRKYGMLGVIEYFVSETEDPHFVDQLNHLKEQWIPQRQKWIATEETTQAGRDGVQEALDRVIDFTDLLEQEYRGKI
ncbi:MAG: HD domain-containing protein, partial [Candidatus Poribacteria bacterium]|nr:HD domain-containing protein [Candidatus Poribacteria bacterium]